MSTLYCLPYGQSMATEFFRECEKKAYAYGEAIFLTAGKDTLSSQFPVRTMTFDDLAEELLNSNGRPVKLLSVFSQKILLSGLIEEMSNNQQLQFFSPYSQSTALSDMLYAFLQELAHAGIQPEDFARGLVALSDNGDLRKKDREILMLYLAYREILASRKNYDSAGVYFSINELLRKNHPKLAFQKIYISDFCEFTALQVEFIGLLAKYCSIDICLCYQKDERYLATEKAYQELLGLGFESVFRGAQTGDKPLQLVQLCENIFTGNEEIILNTEDVRLKRYANRRQEMQEIVADIKKKMLDGAVAEDFLVCTRKLDFYPGLKREFDLAGLPVCLPDMVRLSTQQTAILLLSVLQIAAGDLQQGLQGFFSSFFVEECLCFNTERIKRVLSESFFANLTEAEQVLAKALPVSDEVNEMFAFFRAFPVQETVLGYNKQLFGFLENMDIVRFVGRLCKERRITFEQTQLLLLGYEKTISKMQELDKSYEDAGEAERELALAQYRKVFEKTCRETSFSIKKAVENGICVQSITAPLKKKYKYIYLLGLKEKEFPLFMQENWLYGDVERQQFRQIGVLQSATQTAAVETFFFLSALAAAEKELWLSVSLADNEIASIYFDEIIRVLGYKHIETRLAGQVLPSVEQVANSDALAGFLLEQQAYDQPWLADYLGKGFFSRVQSDLLNRQKYFNGDLSASALTETIKNKLNMSFNSGSLESYAACPFKFLLEYVWKPENWAEAAEKIRADKKGNIYHDCLKDFLDKYQGKTLLQNDLLLLQRQLEIVFDNAVQKQITKGIIEATYLSQQEFTEMKAALLRWFRVEMGYQAKNRSPFTPCLLEWQFDGLSLETDAGTANIKGRIDRIDTDGEYYLVTDYKMKNTPVKKDIENGLDLQVPLYLLAVEKFLGKPLGGGYFSIEKAERAGGFWLNRADAKVSFAGRQSLPQRGLGDKDWDVYKDVFMQNIRVTIEKISGGYFSPDPQKECPVYCTGQGICRVRQGRGGNFDE